MVTTTKTAATNVSFRARTTTAVTFAEGTAMPAGRRGVHTDRIGGCYDAIRVETTVLPFVVAPQGSRAWSPPS